MSIIHGLFQAARARARGYRNITTFVVSLTILAMGIEIEARADPVDEWLSGDYATGTWGGIRDKVQRLHAPELEKRVRWYQGYRPSSWRVDETYVRLGGKWKYLFRAVDKHGRLIDFMLSDRRNTKAARRFLAKALKVMRTWPPVSITTDKLGSYPKALRRLKREGELKDTVRHRTSKYLNNRIEADHGALKRLIRPTRGFQSKKTAYATIKGFEIMRMIRRRHCMLIEPGVTGEVRFVNKLFDLAA